MILAQVALRYFNVYGPRQALSNPYTGVCAIFSGRLLNDQGQWFSKTANKRVTSYTSATSCRQTCWP